MQTFLPYASFERSAKCLDRQRLGKQRIEVLQILRALTGETKGWVNHPVVKAWRGYEWQLGLYGCRMCEEWMARGYKDTTMVKIERWARYSHGGGCQWVQDPSVHSAYRALLLHKNPEHYGQFGWSEDPCGEFDYILFNKEAADVHP